MLKNLLIWPLLPLSALQGLWLKKAATRLPGAPGERNGAIGQGESLQLLAIGDSIIDGVGTESMNHALPALFARALSDRHGRRVHWQAEGKSGLAIDGLLHRLDSLDAIPPDVILISIGVNDVTGLIGAGQWRERVDRLLNRIQVTWPTAQTVFAGLPPMAMFPLLPQPLRMTLGWRASKLDGIAAAACAGMIAVHHIPTKIDPRLHSFSDDGYHPSSASCTVWAEELADSVSL